MRAVRLLIPDDVPATAGNVVSASRLAACLAALGWDASVRRAGEAAPPPPGTLIHALHAVRAGTRALQLARGVGAPLVVTLTGTDMGAAAAELSEVLQAADAVVVYHEAARAELRGRLPALTTPVEVIPPGVPLPPTARPPRGDALVFLLPGGIRPVKDPLFALEPLRRLHASLPQVRFVLCGPVRDADFGAGVLARLDAIPWARYAGEVPHDEMAEMYADAAVVLNTSRSEGLANAVLEAMACGRAVLASDIPGNRAAIRHGVDGLLYRDAGDFLACSARLAAEPELRRRLGASARRAVAQRFSPAAEGQAHDRLYGRLLAKRAQGCAAR